MDNANEPTGTEPKKIKTEPTITDLTDYHIEELAKRILDGQLTFAELELKVKEKLKRN